MNDRVAKQKLSKKGTPQAYPIPALEKGLDVLELLAQARTSMGLNDIADQLGRSRQELFRVVTCLCVRGYLLRDTIGNYRLGTKMLEIGSGHVAHQLMITQAMPAMEALAEATGESCQLSLLGRQRLLVVAAATGSGHLQLEVKVGNSIPLFNSVVGLVAIAFSPEKDDAISWERRCEIQRQGGDVIEPELREVRDWQERLDAIRRDGYLNAQSSTHIGSRVHASPLLNATGRLVAVLSVARLVAVREEPQRNTTINKALLQCCRTIAVGLGALEGAAIDDESVISRKKSARNDAKTR